VNIKATEVCKIIEYIWKMCKYYAIKPYSLLS